MFFRILARFILATLIAVTPVLSQAQDVQVWLDSGEIDLELENGETVNLKEGEYLSCQGTLCEVLPIAAAPSRPSLAAGGLAPLALGVEAGTLAGAGIVGAVVIAAGVIIGIAAAGDSTNSTTSGQ